LDGASPRIRNGFTIQVNTDAVMQTVARLGEARIDEWGTFQGDVLFVTGNRTYGVIVDDEVVSRVWPVLGNRLTHVSIDSAGDNICEEFPGDSRFSYCILG
jgi:hypothetical protein